MDFEDVVLKKLDKIQEDVTDVKVTQAEHGKDIARNTDDLEKHIEGVVQNRTRIVALEDKTGPITVKQLLKRIVIVAGGIGTIVGTIYGIVKLLDL